MHNPNVLFIRVDQLRADCVGIYGNEFCKTPHIDSLSTNGIIFKSAYTAIAVCSPSRASLFTGLYPHNHKVLMNVHIPTRTCNGIDPEVPNMASMLSQAGYHLEYFGKWHMHNEKPPHDYGFDGYHPILPNDPFGLDSDYIQEGIENLFSNSIGQKSLLSFRREKELIYGTMKLPLEDAPSYRMADSAAQFFVDHFAGDSNPKPLFLNVDFLQPHFPMIPPEPFASMYDPEDVLPWPNFNDNYEDKPAGHKRKHDEWQLQNKEWDWWQKIVAMYYANISYVDHCCGVLLDALDRSGQLDNTIVVFTADHGDTIGSHKHFEKGGTMSEEVYRVPLLMQIPGVSQESKTEERFISSVDLMPTLIELCTGQTVDDIDGKSIVPLLSNNSTSVSWRNSIFAEYHGDVWGPYTQRMVRNDLYKYVYNPYDKDELYDMVNDPYEMKNLAYIQEFAPQLEEMRALLHGWILDSNDMLTHPYVLRNFPEPKMP
jgi:arylsulfatase A-like enzyme